VEIKHTGTVGFLLSYDRTGSAYKNLTLSGSDIALAVGGTNKWTMDASGNVVNSGTLNSGALAATTGTFSAGVGITGDSSFTGGVFFFGDSVTTPTINNGAIHCRRNGVTNPLRLGTYNDTPSSQNWLAFDRAGGTIAAPTSVLNGFVFGSIVGVGCYHHDGEPSHHGPQITLSATEDWGENGHGGLGNAIEFFTTPIGSGAAAISTLQLASGLVNVPVAMTATTIATSGGVGIYAPVNAAFALSLYGASGMTGTSQYGIVDFPMFGGGATTKGTCLGIAFETAAAAFTMVNGYGITIETPGIGAGSSVTNLFGLYIANQTGGSTLNYAIKCNGGQVNLALPTSNAGLAAGSLWSNAGIVTVA
jgi:hypothetical protein